MLLSFNLIGPLSFVNTSGFKSNNYNSFPLHTTDELFIDISFLLSISMIISAYFKFRSTESKVK